MARRSRLSPADKSEAVLMLLRREDTAARLTRMLGISEQSLYRFRDQFLTAGRAGLSGNVEAEKRIRELEQDIEEREKVIDELTIANRTPVRGSEGSP